MADRLAPGNKQIVKRIRAYEKQMFLEHNFKQYRNYHLPEKLVKDSTRVLSFGVGSDANFEKLICLDNRNLDVRMFDPTPWTVLNLGGILHKGGHKVFKQMEDGEQISRDIVRENLKFKPYAYAPKNGQMKFYYKKEEGVSSPIDVQGCFTLIDHHEDSKHIEVDCKNIQTILNELEWPGIDILKTDVEGLWYDVGKEIKDIDVKCWVTEIELNVGMTYDEAFDKVTELVELHKNKYNIYTNRKRLKPMMELIFCRKDIDES